MRVFFFPFGETSTSHFTYYYIWREGSRGGVIRVWWSFVLERRGNWILSLSSRFPNSFHSPTRSRILIGYLRLFVVSSTSEVPPRIESAVAAIEIKLVGQRGNKEESVWAPCAHNFEWNIDSQLIGCARDLEEGFLTPRIDSLRLQLWLFREAPG